MTFSEALTEAMTSQVGLCQIGEAIAAMEATDALTATAAVDDPAVPDRALAEAVSQVAGWVVDSATLAAHRRHACTCILGEAL